MAENVPTSRSITAIAIKSDLANQIAAFKPYLIAGLAVFTAV